MKKNKWKIREWSNSWINGNKRPLERLSDILKIFINMSVKEKPNYLSCSAPKLEITNSQGWSPKK